MPTQGQNKPRSLARASSSKAPHGPRDSDLSFQSWINLGDVLKPAWRCARHLRSPSAHGPQRRLPRPPSPSPSRSSGPIHLSPTFVGARIDALLHCHACFRIWPLLEGGKTGGQLKRARIRRRIERFQRPPVRCLSPHSAGHTSQGHLRRGTYGAPSASGAEPTDMLAVSAGHAGLSGALRTVEPLPRWEVTAALPDTRCAPGSREDDGQDYAGDGNGVGRFIQIIFIIKQDQWLGGQMAKFCPRSSQPTL